MEAANIFVPIALVAFVPIAFAALARLGPRRGVLASLLGGWLFLPSIDGWFDLPLLHTKAAFVPAVVLLASFVLDFNRWRAFRPRLLDAPVALWCAVPFASSLANGLGAYDGLAVALQTTLSWGAPYFLGRLYLGDPRGLTDLATSLVTGALVYVPLCLWEIRMSPQLHRIVYGFHTFGFFGVAVRFDGFRPSVFMSDGLMLGMFMTSATLSAVWLWRTGARRAIAGLPLSSVALVLTVTTVLCKSTGALVLLGVGLAVLECTRWLRTPVLVLILLATPAAYCTARLSGWSGEELVTLSRQAVNEDRAGSLHFRLLNEDMLIEKARERPILGWGGWGRNRVYDEEGNDISVTDGLWVLAFGMTGLVGLASLMIVLAIPAILLVRRFPARHWGDPRMAGPVALAVVLLLWAVDDLLNAMTIPTYPLMAGALVSFSTLPWRVRRVRARPTSLPAARAGPAESYAR